MKSYLLALVSLYSLTIHAHDLEQLEKEIFYCPEKIECYENGECDFFGKDKEHFKYYTVPTSVQIGTYNFYSTGYLGPGATSSAGAWPYEQLTFIYCSYRSSLDQRIHLRAFNGISIEPLLENWTKWKQKSPSSPNTSSPNICDATLSSQCPFKQYDGIILENIIRDKKGDIYLSDNKPVSMSFNANYNFIKNPTKTISVITHDTLSKCINLSRCEITIGVNLPPDKIFHTGKIYVNVLDNDKIVDISPLDGKPNMTMVLSPQFPNTIIFKYN